MRIARSPALWLALLCTVWLLGSTVSQAEPSDEETRKLLEKSLSVIEIDKEIERVSREKDELAQQIGQLELDIENKESAVADHQEAAGRVLRAYYMGERDSLLTALLSADNLNSLLSMLDYFGLIFSHDRDVLNKYKTEYQQLTSSRNSVVQQRQRLDQVGNNLIAQRARLVALQQDIDSNMSKRNDSERMQLLIDEMSNFWENVGLYEVRHYFGALADAMQQLPGWLKNNPSLAQFKGLEYNITIPEEALNEFLREQNELFNNFSFVFGDGEVAVQGKRDGLEIAITGRYVLENDPVNAIRFHVGELVFNGLTLPDTTKKALEEEFDLGFYPKNLISFIQAKSVNIADGKLTVKLKLEL
ncbi:hypothetical protein EBB07_33155 [Paenibacillaceae bacterium]|nr:hypothetical protein EBB07_33155 [Paenibacillaceae bacterium]